MGTSYSIRIDILEAHNFQNVAPLVGDLEAAPVHQRILQNTLSYRLASGLPSLLDRCRKRRKLGSLDVFIVELDVPDVEEELHASISYELARLLMHKALSTTSTARRREVLVGEVVLLVAPNLRGLRPSAPRPLRPIVGA